MHITRVCYAAELHGNCVTTNLTTSMFSATSHYLHWLSQLESLLIKEFLRYVSYWAMVDWFEISLLNVLVAIHCRPISVVKDLKMFDKEPTRKIQEFLRPAKDARDPLSSCGVYCMHYSCGHVYIGTMKHSVHTHIG